ncbi:sporulation inhibitor of replication protein SirA [Bacillus sp. M6-12]|uniref:sporulation inhibitor of replication protein SirA n=1 Tax=Bacillus sp. M6-12 TaxID=2054166 RepID=UPI000C76C615|nr:sporulation inhibitor of replication protein SirA [Bacillus sp. M6-12]PLS16781.1 sporulation inhibitor of replication protein SirA [Bacillus sp. M6-12]
MRNYLIYLIEEEFARHYYGREKLFFNLFLEHNVATGIKKDILQKQIEFVTKPIPTLHIQNLFEQLSVGRKDFSFQKGVYYIEKKNGRSKATLTLHQKHLAIKAEGNFEAETSFFESIRKCEPCFLALDLENRRYGWLKPIKERKFV